jgi:hypothetical protein
VCAAARRARGPAGPEGAEPTMRRRKGSGGGGGFGWEVAPEVGVVLGWMRGGEGRELKGPTTEVLGELCVVAPGRVKVLALYDGVCEDAVARWDGRGREMGTGLCMSAWMYS